MSQFHLRNVNVILSVWRVWILCTAANRFDDADSVGNTLLQNSDLDFIWNSVLVLAITRYNRPLFAIYFQLTFSPIYLAIFFSSFTAEIVAFPIKQQNNANTKQYTRSAYVLYTQTHLQYTRKQMYTLKFPRHMPILERDFLRAIVLIRKS